MRLTWSRLRMTASVPFEPAQTEVEIAAIVPAARTDKTDALFMSGVFSGMFSD